MKGISKYVKPYFNHLADGKSEFCGVEVNVGGEHFVIEPRDIDKGKERTWDETMDRLKELHAKTFNWRQICATMMFRKEIDEIMKSCGWQPLDKWYWTMEESPCAEYSADYAVHYYGYNGTLCHNVKHYSYSCRAVLALDSNLESSSFCEDGSPSLNERVASLEADMDKIKNLFK